MSVFDKSLRAMDNYLEHVDKDELQRIINEVSEMDFEGPTIEEFFNSVFHNNTLEFIFQPGVTPHTSSPPPLMCNFIPENNQTPKYPLESFFS